MNRLEKLSNLEPYWEHVTRSYVEPGESPPPPSFRNRLPRVKAEVAGTPLHPAWPGASSFSMGLATHGSPVLSEFSFLLYRGDSRGWRTLRPHKETWSKAGSDLESAERTVTPNSCSLVSGTLTAPFFKFLLKGRTNVSAQRSSCRSKPGLGTLFSFISLISIWYAICLLVYGLLIGIYTHCRILRASEPAKGFIGTW